MNIIKIAKQIFAYSKYLSKLSNKVQQSLLKDLFKNKKYEQLSEKEKNTLNNQIKRTLDDIESYINDITDNINQKTFIANCYLNGSYIPGEDDEKFEQALALYNTYKKHKQITKKDIKQYKNYSELYKDVSYFLSTENVYDFANQYCDKITSEGQFSVYRVDNFEQAKVLFNGTGWCVKGRGYFESYGAPYYLVFKGQEKFALIHFDSQQCKDVTDDTIYSQNVTKNFAILLVKLFNEENYPYIFENDFEGYEYYYLKYGSKYMDEDQAFMLINQVINRGDFQKIYDVLKGLEEANLLHQALSEERTLIYLEDEIQKGNSETSYFQQVIQLLLDNNIAIGYPDAVFWYVSEKDDVDLWKKLMKNYSSEDWSDVYEQCILAAPDILKYEIENGFVIMWWMLNDRNFDYNIKCVLNDLVEDVNDIEGAKQFMKHFEPMSDEEEKQFFDWIEENLDLTDEQIQIFEKLYKKILQKRAFDAHPSLPGF